MAMRIRSFESTGRLDFCPYTHCDGDDDVLCCSGLLQRGLPQSPCGGGAPCPLGLLEYIPYGGDGDGDFQYRSRLTLLQSLYGDGVPGLLSLCQNLDYGGGGEDYCVLLC
jgi:hypothetical protein